MKRNQINSDELLNRGLEAIRSEEIDATAASRVWSRIEAERATAAGPAKQVERIEGCADYQALIPAYLLGSLTESRTLLVEDHVRECVPCRKALRDARGARTPVARPVSKRHFKLPPAARRAVAAALVLGSVAVPLAFMRDFMPPVYASSVVVEQADGPVLRVTTTEAERLELGDQVALGEGIRTAREAGALVRVGDAAVIEMRERSQFRVVESAARTTLLLDRGSIIVRPGSDGATTFAVATTDCLVMGPSATYAVSSGIKGSRVSAVSGELAVDLAGEERRVVGGEQVSTNPSLAGVPVRDDVAWSRSSEDLENLLAQISSLRADLNARVSMPETRYESRLLGLLPEATAFYAAIPNLGGTIAEAQAVIDEHVDSNPALRDFLQSNDASKQEAVRSALDRVRELTSYLGSEIVVSASAGQGEGAEVPLVLAELSDPTGLRAYLDQHRPSGLHFVDDLAAAPSADASALYVWFAGPTLVASPSLEAIRGVASAMTSPDANPFLTTPFYSRLAALYREGAGIIVAVDLHQVISQDATDAKKQAAYSRLGLSDLRGLVFTQKGSGNALTSQAILTFGGERRGITTWLAAPGPMGALEYVSPEATAATAFVIDKPVALVDDLFEFLHTVDPEAWQRFQRLQGEHGIDVRQNFAAPLGGEFVFAVDGPLLPTPSWKMILEVYDPAVLQTTIEQAVAEINRMAATEGHQGLSWEQVEANGLTFYTLNSADTGLAMTYVFTNGYLVAGPNRGVVERALLSQSSGASLPNSARFKAELPVGSEANFSALIYHDVAALVRPFAGQIAKMAGEEKEIITQLGQADGPTVIVARAGTDQIAFSGRSGGASIGLTPEMLFAGPGSLGLKEILSGTLPN